MKRGLVLLIAYVLANILSAQQFPLTIIDFEDGINKSTFYEVVKDKQGYMWMASDGALIRYDGKDFVSYTNQDGFSGSYLSDIDFDSNGRLWVSTYGGGIAIFNGYKFYSFDTKKGFPVDYIRDATFSSLGEMWVATEDSGVIRVKNGLPIVLRNENNLSFGDCWNVVEMSTGDIWAAFPRGGVGKFSKKDNYAYKTMYAKEPYRFTSVAEDKNGCIWAAGAFCLVKIQNDSVIDCSSRLPPNSIVLDIHIGKKDGKIYLATANNLVVFDDTVYTILDKTNGIKNSQFWNIYEDEANDIWLSSGGGGIVKYDNYGIRIFKGHDDLLFNSRIIDIVDDHSGKIIVGTELNGFFYFENNSFHQFNLPGIKDVVTAFAAIYNKEHNLTLLASSGSGSVYWLRNGKLLNEYVPLTEHSKLIYDVELIDTNKVMIASDQGCFIVEPHLNKPTLIEQIPVGYYRSLFKDNNNVIWILGDNGNLFSYKDNHVIDFRNIINPDGFSLMDGFYDTAHHLYWFCTNSGLIVWDGRNRLVLHSKNGLNSDAPQAITIDKNGNVWVGHDNGITTIDLVNKKFNYIGYDDGFIGVATNFRSITFSNSGDLLVGSGNDLYMIDPNRLLKINKSTQLRLQEVSFKGVIYFKENYFTDSLPTLNLQYYENSFQFDLAALDFVNAAKVKYTWKLTGFDDDFMPYTHLNEVSYTNLPPGDYEFIAKAIDSEGFETNEIKMKIYIAKPVWEKLWFYALEIFIFIIIAVMSFVISGKKSNNRFGQVMTFLTIIIFFESAIFYLSNFINPLTNGIPIFQLLMNIILAVILQPMEQLVRKLMTRKRV